MTDDSIQLRNIDPDDISDVLTKIERSFDLRFSKNDFQNVKTFGDLCDVITNKVQGDNINDCSTQQAFYKIRNAIALTQNLDKIKIMPQTEIDQIFSDNKRRQKVRYFERELGFSVDILEIKEWQKLVIFSGICLSITTFFFKWQYALAGLVIFTSFGWIMTTFFATELNKQTIGQLSERLTKERYSKVRRNMPTVNKSEVGGLVKSLFMEHLDLAESALTRQATFA